MAPAYVAQSMKVVITSSGDQPDGCLRELNGLSPDINAGYGNKFSWLVPNWTQIPQAAASGFSVFHQPDPVPLLDDMAASTGGDYRFQVAIPDVNQPKKIYDLKLWRVPADWPQSDPPALWDGISANINDGRGVFGPDTNLYIIWKFHDFSATEDVPVADESVGLEAREVRKHESRLPHENLDN